MSFLRKSKQDVTSEFPEEEKKEEEEEEVPIDSPSVGTSSFFITAVPSLEDDTEAGGSRKQKKSRSGPNCCLRFAAELNPFQSWFAVTEVGTNRKIDIPDSFAPASCIAFLWKLVATAFTISTMVYGLVESGNSAQYYFAYLTNWALLLSTLYFPCSLLNTVLAARTPQPPDTAGCRIRTTWVLYEMAQNLELVVTVLYWVLQYKPGETELSFLSIVPHSAIAFILFIDGNFVNRIPVRWMHWYGFVLPLQLIYIAWTVLRDLVLEPVKGEPDTSQMSHSLYTAIDWNDDWLYALVVSLIILFGIGPALYLIMWLVSAYHIPCLCMKDRHVYIDRDYDDTANENKAKVNDVEEGSIFASWKY